jgi:hypothetical protein
MEIRRAAALSYVETYHNTMAFVAVIGQGDDEVIIGVARFGQDAVLVTW